MEKKATKDELRERIVSVANKAFMEHGIRSVKMDDIAAMLGISKRTLYETFVDKEALLFECVRRDHERKHREAEEIYRNSDNVLEVILRILQRMMTTFREINHDFFFDINRYPRVVEYIDNQKCMSAESTIEFFYKGVEQGVFRSDINMEIMTLMMRNQGDFIMKSDICKKFTLDEVYESVMYVHLRGMATEKGLQMLDEFKRKNEKTNK